MKTVVSKPTKVALCRQCKGSGEVEGRTPEEHHTCSHCEGSGRIFVSCEMILDIRPYKPRTNIHK